MEIPSLFFAWLSEQGERDDEVGALARYAIEEPGWPCGESAKEPLRRFLRAQGHAELSRALAMALAEFAEEAVFFFGYDEKFFREQIAESDLARMAKSAFLAWADLHFCSRGEVEALADQGDPRALCVLAMLIFSGAGAPINPEVALGLLRRALKAGYLPAARALEFGSRLVHDEEGAIEALLTGVRGGDAECAAELYARFSTDEADATMRYRMTREEARALTLQVLGDTGEAEWSAGAAYEARGEEARSRELYAAAAAKGWPEAMGDLAAVLTREGREKEAASWRERAAAAGDVGAKGICALGLLGGEMGISYGDPGWEEVIGDLQYAVDRGFMPGLLPLAIHLLVAAGPEGDREPVKMLLAANILLCHSDEEARRGSEMLHGAFPGVRRLPVNLAERWLFTTAARTRARVIVLTAAQVWLEGGFRMSLP